MHASYSDITSRIAEPPAWWDENGTPRWGHFEPRACADIYANEAALVEIACQSCRRRFRVAMTLSAMDRVRAMMNNRPFQTLAGQIMARSLAYGDPPNAGCCDAGPTITSDAIRVLQFWRRVDCEWRADHSLELRLDEEVAA